jgi:hypothetical protein
MRTLLTMAVATLNLELVWTNEEEARESFVGLVATAVTKFVRSTRSNDHLRNSQSLDIVGGNKF